LAHATKDCIKATTIALIRSDFGLPHAYDPSWAAIVRLRLRLHNENESNLYLPIDSCHAPKARHL